MSGARVQTEQVIIQRVGHRGDGIADTPSGPLYVPYTLPGETVTVTREEDRARLVEIVAPSSERVTPVCTHFGTCGGCLLQHWAHDRYLDWKHGQVAAALAARGLVAEVAPVKGTRRKGRRRAMLAAVATRAGVVLGYHARFSRDVVQIDHCPVLACELDVALPALRDLLAPHLEPGVRLKITVTASRAGLDLVIDGMSAPRRPGALAALAAAAAKAGVARLAWDGETLLQLASPAQEFDGACVVPPPGAFLQASAFAEDLLAGLVLDGVGKARHVADLFAGCGTFTLRLARKARVSAFESDRAALAALAQAARGPGLKQVTATVRDLFREPLSGPELKGFDVVVLDPPFAGAKAQAETLAASPVPRIVMVSCNPATFARDARTLVDGGYRLKSVVPVDQFVFSPHIEVVGKFERR